MDIGVLGVLILPLMYVVPVLLLYVIIRFGVKHGMRSYYAEAARRAVPAGGIIGATAAGPTAVYPTDGFSEGTPS
ncbi:hypothetical protein ACX80H_10910 [Arthrobacter sp. MDT2-2]